METPEYFNVALASGTPCKEALIWLGELAVIHTTAKETNGRYAVVELYATKEGEVPCLARTPS
jgi:hypothetical protein